MSKYRFVLAATLLLPLLISSACGGGEEPAPAESEPTAEPSSAATTPDLSQAGAITGKVAFEGAPPKPRRIRMGAEPQCEHKHEGGVVSEEVVVNDNGTLKNVFVWVKSGLEQYSFPAPSEPVVLNQDGCVYKPHVLGVQVKQEIEIVNSDPVTHNIHPVPQHNREWNVSQSPEQQLKKAFARSEIMIPVKCNVHPWMKSYIGVVPHPYFAVTGGDGTFRIENLPPGQYTLQTWHEKFGTLELQVSLGAKESKEVEFTYQG